MRQFRFQATLLSITITMVSIGWYVSVALAGGHELPLRHTDEGEDLRVCTTCHAIDDETFPYRIFDHTNAFVKRHGRRASQNEAVCNMCHQQRFCTDCHAVGTELKPSLKNHGDPKRSMPHRGDYLTRHRIDGRIDPVQCFGCHGNPKTQRSCRPCHG